MELDYIKLFQEERGFSIPKSHILNLYEIAKETLINLLFKTYFIVPEYKKMMAYKKYKYWILKCMLEIHDKKGFNGVTGYSENGLSITWDSSQISKELRNELMSLGRLL